MDDEEEHGEDRGSFGGDRPRRGGRGFGGGDRPMYDAVCSDCGKECQVPFKPTEGRPVYCRDCFRKHRPPRGPRY